jgi:hypothetical protein
MNLDDIVSGVFIMDEKGLTRKATYRDLLPLMQKFVRDGLIECTHEMEMGGGQEH